MNETIQEANAAACLRHSEHHYPESSTIKGPDWEMRKGFCESNYRDGFEAGAEWAQPRWIPVAERLPDYDQKCLCICDDAPDNSTIVGDYEAASVFRDASGYSWRVKYWCPIPESLLNFKP
jgi:hypothetical protein